MVHALILAFMVLWTSLAFGQSVPGRFPPGTVYGNPGATEANPSTVKTFSTQWTTAGRPGSPAQGAFGLNTDTDTWEFWDGSSWISSVKEISIFDFGAQCNGVTSHDDAPAINAAITYAKTHPNLFGTSTSPAIVGSRSRVCVLLTTVDMTGITSVSGTRPLFANMTLYCLLTGSACIDAMGGFGITWSNISITTGGANSPTYGIQTGRTVLTGAAGQMLFQDVSMFGRFSQCGFYTLAGEGNVLLSVIIKNTIGGYAACFDGNNNFNPPTLASPNLTASPHTALSFIGTRVDASWFQSRGGADSVPLWIGGATQFTTKNLYMCAACDSTGTATRHARIDLFGAGGQGAIDFEIQGNFEVTVPSSIEFTYTGTGTPLAGKIRSFKLEGIGNAASGGLLKIDTTKLTGITAEDFTYKQAWLTASLPSETLFVPAETSLWTVSGHVHVPQASVWNEPAAFSGVLCIASTCTNRMATQTWTTATRPASPAVGQFGYNTDTDILEFYNPATAQWESATDGVVNVKAFGAKGTFVGSNNDTTAINNAIAYAHTLGPAVQGQPVKILFPPGTYVINDTINLTGFGQLNIPAQDNGFGLVVEGYGAYIRASTISWTDGHPMIDMLGSHGMTIRGLNLTPFCTVSHTVNVGIQFGRVATTSGAIAYSAGRHSFSDISINGCVTLAGLYDRASEQDLFINVDVKLSPAPTPVTPTNSNGPYNYIMDGSNHWGVTSNFSNAQPTSPDLALAANTHISFISTTWIGGNLIQATSSTARPLWISLDAEKVRFYNTYMNYGPGSTSTDTCVYVQADGASSNTSATWEFDFNCEGGTAGQKGVFMFGGAYASPAVHDFRVKIGSPGSFTTNSRFFAIDSTSSVTSVTIRNFDVAVEREVGGMSQVIFDDPTKYTVDGNFYSETASLWNRPSSPGSFTGCVSLAGNRVCSLQPRTAAQVLAVTCNADSEGMQYAVKDANSAVFNAAVAAGGANHMAAYCNGTSWVVH